MRALITLAVSARLLAKTPSVILERIVSFIGQQVASLSHVGLTAGGVCRPYIETKQLAIGPVHRYYAVTYAPPRKLGAQGRRGARKTMHNLQFSCRLRFWPWIPNFFAGPRIDPSKGDPIEMDIKVTLRCILDEDHYMVSLSLCHSLRLIARASPHCHHR